MKRCALFVIAIAVLLSGLCAVDDNNSVQMTMTFDASKLKRPEYKVGFTKSEITSEGFSNSTTATLVADYSTQTFKPYDLFLSYYLRDNAAVAIYLDLNSNLTSDDGSSLAYIVTFNDGHSVSSNGANKSLKIASVPAATSVGQFTMGSLPFTIYVDSFASLPSTTLTSTMTVRVQSEV